MPKWHRLQRVLSLAVPGNGARLVLIVAVRKLSAAAVQSVKTWSLIHGWMECMGRSILE